MRRMPSQLFFPDRIADPLKPPISTPTYAKFAQQTAPAAYNLERARPIVLLDLGESVPQVPVGYFEDHLLPPLPPDVDMENVLARLRQPRSEDGLQVASAQGSRLRGFSVDPVKDKRWELDIFDRFEDATRAIHEATGLPDDRRSVEFRCNPNTLPKSSNRENSSRPDSYAIEVGVQPNGAEWQRIAIPGEFKKSEADADDNRSKIVWSLSHILREDIRRRFVFGYTIENTAMRFWFCNRSDIVVSTPFNFVTDLRTFVDFVVRIMYAKPVDLGWDPTITRSVCPITQRTHFDITVQPRDGPPVIYRTKGILSSIDAEAVRGRGTRVWKAARLINGKESGPLVAIKDSWVDSDRDREGDILSKIRASATPGSQEADMFKNHLLTVECFGDVMIDGEPDSTDALHRRGAAISATYGRLELNLKSHRQSLKSEQIPAVNAIPLPISDANTDAGAAAVDYLAKTHHRIVFKEVGTPIHAVDSLPVVFEALRNLVFALRAMHTCRWVHRDISSGNVLIVDGVVKLTDVEYAKHEDDKSHHGIRTGTAFFMSTEVDSHQYHHRDAGSPSSASITAYSAEACLAIMKGVATTPLDTLPEVDEDEEDEEDTNFEAEVVPFSYNPLHDMESLWWLSVYLLIARRFVERGTAVQNFAELMHRQSVLATYLFYNARNRLAVMTAGGSFKTTLRTLRLHPDVAFCGKRLEQARASLTHCFRLAEKDMARIKFATVASTDSGVSDLYSAMFAVLHAIHERLRKDGHRVLIDESDLKRARGCAGGEDTAVQARHAVSALPLPTHETSTSISAGPSNVRSPRKVIKITATSTPRGSLNASKSPKMKEP